jgi:hypothetical protein
MSHIAEEYAKSLGVRIGKPIISEHFYPIVSNNYITFHTNNKKSPARHYDLWKIVFELIKGKLSENNIDIIQVGGADDPVYPECDYDTLNATFKQMSYIMKGTKLHLGIDSLPVHLASLYDRPIVGLYSNLYPECSKPIWNKSSKTIQLAPDFSETKPSFRDNEDPKRVNEIYPEAIAKAVLDSLEIENDLDTYETLNIGKHYFNKIIEIVPNFIPTEEFNFKNLINLRCDYELLEESLPYWLSRRVNLMINKAIDINLVYRARQNIKGMTIFIGDESINEEYLKMLSKLNINYNLISKDKEKISDLRLKFFDYTVEEYSPKIKKDLDFTENVCDNTFYHSNKTLISNNKKYYSKAAWKINLETTDDRQQLIDSKEFWEEVEHMNIYNYGEIKK